MTSEVTPELFASVPDQDGRFGRLRQACRGDADVGAG